MPSDRNFFELTLVTERANTDGIRFYIGAYCFGLPQSPELPIRFPPLSLWLLIHSLGSSSLLRHTVSQNALIIQKEIQKETAHLVIVFKSFRISPT